MTCVDCNVTFPGDDYRTHTSCISEAERYERTVYRGVKKGEKSKGGKRTPQEAWNDIVEKAAERKEEADATIRGYLAQLVDCVNVPRKEKQFKNFTSNSLRLRGQDREVSMMWEFLVGLRQEKNDAKEKEKKEEERKKEAVKEEIKEKEEKEKLEKSEKSEKSDTLSGKKRALDPPSTTSSISSSAGVKILKKALKSSPSNTLKLRELRAQTHRKFLKKDIYSGDDDDGFKKLLKGIVKGSDKLVIEGKNVGLAKSAE